MKLKLIAVLGFVLLVSQVSAEEKPALKDQKDKVSYSIGMDIGNNLKKQSIDIDPDILAQGIKDTFSGGRTLLPEQEFRDTLTAFQIELRANRIKRKKELAEKKKTEGESFLAENKKKEGVITLPRGLQYKIVKEGTGETPKLEDT